jgi:hypothetical protein
MPDATLAWSVRGTSGGLALRVATSDQSILPRPQALWLLRLSSPWPSASRDSGSADSS